MLKKVTTYLPEKDLRVLKRLSSKKKTSVAHLVRMGARYISQNTSAFQKMEDAEVWRNLEQIRRSVEKQGMSSEQIMEWAVQAQREVRHEMAKERSRHLR